MNTEPDIGLPANLDCERSVIGAVLLNESAWLAAALAVDDFSMDAHRRIWRAMAALCEDATPIDPRTLIEELAKRKELEAIGGARYLADLTENLPRSLNVAHYAAIVREKAVLRRLVLAGNQLARQALDQSETSADILRRHEDSVFDIRRQYCAATFATLDDVPTLAAVNDSLRIDWIADQFIPRGALVMLFGMRGSFKSWLALDLARHVSNGTHWAMMRCEKRRVLYLDAEMSEVLVAERKRQLATGTPEQLHYWFSRPDQEPPCSISDRRLVKFAGDHQPLIIFDSLIRFARCPENKAEEVAKVIERFRTLTFLGATVLVIMHKSDKPGSPDYRGSSDWLAGPDVGWLLERRGDTETIDLTCKKNRYAKHGSMSLELRPGGFVPLSAPREERGWKGYT